MFQNPFSFKGRIRRTEFGLSYLLVIVISYGTGIFASLVEEYNLAVAGLYIGAYWLLFAQGAKRCHDMGQSGWFQIVPFYIFVMLFSEGERKTNRFGGDPKLEELERDQQKRRGSNYPTKEEILEGVPMSLSVSQLLTVVLATILITLVLTTSLENQTLVYWMEMFFLILGYFVLLWITHKGQPLSRHPWFYRAQRMAFALLSLLLYNLYLFTFTPGMLQGYSIELLVFDISYILNTFIITYVPYLVYQKIFKAPVPYESA